MKCWVRTFSHSLLLSMQFWVPMLCSCIIPLPFLHKFGGKKKTKNNFLCDETASKAGLKNIIPWMQKRILQLNSSNLIFCKETGSWIKHKSYEKLRNMKSSIGNKKKKKEKEKLVRPQQHMIKFKKAKQPKRPGLQLQLKCREQCLHFPFGVRVQSLPHLHSLLQRYASQKPRQPSSR